MYSARQLARKSMRSHLVIAAIAVLAFATLALSKDKDVISLQPVAGSYRNTAVQFHSVVPLGMDLLQLQPSGKILSLLASATCPDLEGVKRVPAARNVSLTDASGQPVRYFPRQVDFRVSITADAVEQDPDPEPIESQLTADQFMLGLKFRLKVFRGLDSFTIEPDNVEQIGAPPDASANQRIYIAHFTLGKMPATDRVMLEVLSPSGERVSRFHLELL